MARGVGINTSILSDETFDKLCITCKRKDENIEAEKYCIDCQDYYCLKCVKVHEYVPLLSDHEINDKDELQFNTSSTLPMPTAPTEQCDRHKHKHVDMYCENHDIVGCSTCMTVDHGSCKGRFYISEYIKIDLTFDAVDQELKFIAKSLEENQTYFQHNKQLLLEEKSKLLEDIKRFRQEINAKFDELQKTTLHEVQAEFDTLIKDADDQFNHLQTSKENVKLTVNKFGSSSISESQKFVNYKKGKQIVERIDEQLEEISQQKQNISIEFEPFQELQAALEKVNGLCKVSQTKRQDFLIQTSGKVKHSVRLKTDEEICRIVSACVVADGTIILSDRENKNLKRYNNSTSETEHYQLTGQPWQVCTIRRNKVAVCVSDIKTVEFISIENKMTKTTEIKKSFDCYGIVYSCNNLYISDSDTSVYLYNLSGMKLGQFTKDIFGKKLFSDIRCLAMHGSNIYVSDLTKGLIILDKDGTTTGLVDGTKIQSSSCCLLTARGNLLIYDNGSESVIQFTENGKFVGTVVKPTPFELNFLNQKKLFLINR